MIDVSVGRASINDNPFHDMLAARRRNATGHPGGGRHWSHTPGTSTTFHIHSTCLGYFLDFNELNLHWWSDLHVIKFNVLTKQHWQNVVESLDYFNELNLHWWSDFHVIKFNFLTKQYWQLVVESFKSLYQLEYFFEMSVTDSVDILQKCWY